MADYMLLGGEHHAGPRMLPASTHVVRRKGLKDNDLIKPIEKLGPEGRAELSLDSGAHRIVRFPTLGRAALHIRARERKDPP